MYKCKLGGDATRKQEKHSGFECMCDASCEPHIHEEATKLFPATILCMHDGITDHGHCPNYGGEVYVSKA